MKKDTKIQKAPKDKAHGTCHSTMSSWKLKATEKGRRTSRSSSAGKAKITIKIPPKEGWTPENVGKK